MIITLDIMKSVMEYVWQDANNGFRSKLRTLDSKVAELIKTCDDPVERATKVPQWNYDGSSTDQVTGKDSEVVLQPIYCVICPFRGGNGNHFTVLCNTMTNDGTSLTHYTWAKKIFSQQQVKTADPWYGLEQEYVIMHNDLPLGYKDGTVPNIYYCGVGAGPEHSTCRRVAERHYSACIFAGFDISGINAEVSPGQWEFQIGPAKGLTAAMQLLLARFFLIRVAEDYGLSVSFHPKPITYQAAGLNGSGCHANFSTANMRSDGGAEHIMKAIKKLSKNHEFHMKHYGQDNELRMTGTNETSSYTKFSFGQADRGASVRVPNEVIKNKCGYFEDRRPASNCDPYLVTGLLVSTVLDVDSEEIDSS